jgi:uncharacterized membrane protein YqjE
MATRQYPHPVPGNSIGDSIAELADDTAQLVRLEIELFKQELLELAWRNAIAIGMLAVAALGVLFFAIFAQVLIVQAVPNHIVAAAVITAFWLLIAIGLALLGKSRFRVPKPEATIQTLKDDLEWVKQQIKPEAR